MGKNGYEVGSVDYFKNLNEKSIVGDLMREFCRSSSSTQYSKAVDGVCKRAQDAIYDIHSDLKKHAAFLRYFPKSERDSLTLVVKGLDELLKLGSYTRNSTANACVSLLTLQSSETKPKSRESMQNLEAAAKLVKNGGKVRVTYATGYDLIKRAASDGVQRAASSDLNKQAFFNAVVGNRSKEFVQDLWVLMQYQKEKHRLTGRCGKVICSRDYMDKIEAQVFGKAQSWVGDCESYFLVITDGFSQMEKTIKADLEQPVCPIREDLQNDFVQLAEQLDKMFGFTLYNKIKPGHLFRDAKNVDSGPDPKKAYDYVYTDQTHYYIKDERPNTLGTEVDHYYAEFEGEIYPANSRETVTKYDWYTIDTDFLNTTMIEKFWIADEKDTDIMRVLLESANAHGELNFKYYLDQQELYLINGIVCNRNEAGNFMWTCYLASKGYGNDLQDTLAEFGSLVLEKRWDEPEDAFMRWEGIRYFYQLLGKDQEFMKKHLPNYKHPWIQN